MISYDGSTKDACVLVPPIDACVRVCVLGCFLWKCERDRSNERDRECFQLLGFY